MIPSFRKYKGAALFPPSSLLTQFLAFKPRLLRTNLVRAKSSQELVHDSMNVYLSEVRAIAHVSKKSCAPGFHERAFKNHHAEKSMEANAAAMDSLSSSYGCFCFQKVRASNRSAHNHACFF